MARRPARRRLGLIAALAAAATGAPALAGNLVITGHDDDLHMSVGSADAQSQLAAMVAFARSGAPNPGLPVLVFDHGALLSQDLAQLHIATTVVDPDQPIDPAVFNVRRFSAVGVASGGGCGGCDNDAASTQNLKAARAGFRQFFNAGGGVFAFAGGDDPDYYDFLPATASAVGRPNDTGYTKGPSAAADIPPVNNDATHNFFATPGTKGEDKLFQVVEQYSGPDGMGGQATNAPATLAIGNAQMGAAGFTQAPGPTGEAAPGAHAARTETLMDATTVVVTFGLLAFLVERLTNGLAVLLGYWPWWRKHMELAGAADPVAQAAITRNRRVGLFAMSAVIGVIGAWLARLDLLTALNAKYAAGFAGYVVSGLLIASGADPIRELIQNRANLNPGSRPDPAPIQVTGTLVVSGDVAHLSASED